MKIKQQLFLIFTLFLFSCSSEVENSTGKEADSEKKEELDEVDIYKKFIKDNKIKEKTAFLQSFKFGEPTDEIYKVYHAFYDKNGNLIDSIAYNINTEVFHEQFTYNEDNEMLSRSLLDTLGNVVQSSERKMEDGKEMEFLIKKGDSIYYKQIFAYDTADNLIKITEYDIDGQPRIFSDFTYNENGKMLSKSEKNANGEIQTKIGYAYDKNGNKASITTYNLNGTVEGKTFLKDYNDLGKAQLVEKYDANDSLYAYYKYTYNEKGDEVQSIIYNGIGQIIRQSDAEYNKEGKQTKYSVYEGEVGFIGRDEIKYDSTGKEVEFIMIDKDEKQVKRKLTYYNEKGLIEKEVTYNKIDEPIFQFTYSYSFFE